MKRTPIVLFLLLSLALATGASAAEQNTRSQTGSGPARVIAAPAYTPWSITRVDRPALGSGSDRGRYASVVTAGGTTYVSYYDFTNHDLRLARYWGSGGNCGPGNSWYCSTIDSAGDVGAYSSLAVDPSSSNLHIGIAYYDATNLALKYASYSCGTLICAPPTISTVLDSPMAIAGEYPSLKFDSTGVAHISYLIRSLTWGVGYAHSVSSGGSCGAGAALGKWQCDAIDIGAGIGQYTSLDLNSANQPRIAYYDSTNGDLKYAMWLGTGTGTCGPSNNWWCGRVNFTDDVGRSASMQVDRTTNNAHIAYYDATTGKLKYAHWVGGSGNCGDQFLGNTVWQCDDIDVMGTGLLHAGIALALDAKHNPYIAYQNASEPLAPAVLRIARPYWVTTPLESPNCGPALWVLPKSWVCTTLDNAAEGAGYTNEADYVSVTFNAGGLATVAYYESDSYYDTGYLKVVQQLSKLSLPMIVR